MSGQWPVVSGWYGRRSRVSSAAARVSSAAAQVTTQETALYHKITEMHKPKQDISRRDRKNQSCNRKIAKKNAIKAGMKHRVMTGFFTSRFVRFSEILCLLHENVSCVVGGLLLFVHKNYILYGLVLESNSPFFIFL